MKTTLLLAMLATIRPVAVGAVTIPPPGLHPAERIAFVCRDVPRLMEVVRTRDGLLYRSTSNEPMKFEVAGGRMASTAYSGGGELQASFVNGPWTYVVYERTVRTGFGRTNDPQNESGVDVLVNGRVVTSKRCRNPDAGFNAEVVKDIPMGEFVEHPPGE